MIDNNLDKYTIIKLHKGIFMRTHVNELVNTVKTQIVNGITLFAMDFSEIDNIDIIGLGILRTVQKMSITNNVRIKLFNVKKNIKKILENSCLIIDIVSKGEEEKFIHEEIALIA